MREAALALALLIGACGDETKTDAASVAPVEPAAKPAAGWQYDVVRDEMRERRTWSATLRASNAAKLPGPYAGGSSATILLTQTEDEDPFNTIPRLVLTNAQFDCGGSCELAVRFDDGPVMSAGSALRDCGPDQCVGLLIDRDVDRWAREEDAPGFGKRLLEAESVIIEVPIYKYGAYQYKFETKGLVWPRPGAPTRVSPSPQPPATIKLPDVDGSNIDPNASLVMVPDVP